MSKMIYMLRVFLFIFGMLIFSFPAFSANLAFLYDTPAQYFSADDWKMFESTADYALDKLTSGQSTTWRNPKTGNGGSFTPLNVIKKQGTTCRDLRMINHARHRTDQYIFMFCKVGRSWKIANK